MRRTLFLTLFCLMLTAVCHGAESSPSASTDSTNPPSDSAIVAKDAPVDNDGLGFRFVTFAPMIGFSGMDIVSSFVIGMLDAHLDLYAKPTSHIGVGLEGGALWAWNWFDAILAIPYAAAGLNARFGQLVLEGRVGLALILPYTSVSAAWNIPLGQNVDLKLQTIGLMPITDVGATPIVMIGLGVDLH